MLPRFSENIWTIVERIVSRKSVKDSPAQRMLGVGAAGRLGHRLAANISYSRADAHSQTPWTTRPFDRCWRRGGGLHRYNMKHNLPRNVIQYIVYVISLIKVQPHRYSLTYQQHRPSWWWSCTWSLSLPYYYCRTNLTRPAQPADSSSAPACLCCWT